MRTLFIVCSAIALLLVFLLGIAWAPGFYLLVLVLPLIIVGIYDMVQTEHSLWRNFPLISRGRWFMEWMRPFFRSFWHQDGYLP